MPMLKGLLMYLEREANHGMLREVAGGHAWLHPPCCITQMFLLMNHASC